jgi:aspartate carbamoyltransferase catalytic subunit
VNIISIDELGDDSIQRILTRSKHWFARNREGVHAADGPLLGRLVLNLFYENSTRTLMSFSTAALKLSGNVLSLPVAHSSVQKGETLEDTAHTLCAMKPDLLVVRHPENDAPARIAPIMRCPVINAGDGTHAHPTQALLDAATLMERFGRIDGLKIAICGDIRHSRVAHSDSKLFERLGAEVRLAGPPELLPPGGATCTSVDDAINGADVVVMLRVQRERLETDLGDAPGEYLEKFGLTRERLNRAAPNVAVMHPGPMNRGVEIASDVADDPDRSLIWLQVEMGVATRMACLELLAGTRD